MKKEGATYRHNPRFIIVINHESLVAIDTKTNESLDIKINEINKHPFFFGPWAKIEKVSHTNENPADVKASEKMGKLYDEILKDNQFKTKEDIHSLNIFLSRLLFCFFSEDTGIFSENAFTNAIASHTQSDGSDLDSYLNKLFDILNTNERNNCPVYLADFPYVNGGLFNEKLSAPKFSHKSRRMIIECGELDWSDINPDIFGSMIQAVVHAEQRGSMGMHYTSVPNIMKVIEPLFLNELRDEFEKYYENKNKLEQLSIRLEKIRIFDPACGSGNFLIIAYKELRELEMEIFQRIEELTGNKLLQFSRISISQFYGIEIDDFAHEIAILSLWLIEHQMNMKFQKTFGDAAPTLPLKRSGNIICGNAARINWEDICSKRDSNEIYLLGNPPYLGARNQEENHKIDMEHVFGENYKLLDYIACWFVKAARYIENSDYKAAFVSTNSICQGEQVSILWKYIFEKNIEIYFAHQSFKWENNAKSNAGVICVIIGLRNKCSKIKRIFSDNIEHEVQNINAYLSSGSNVFIQKKSKPISDIPPICFGSMPIDDGNFFLTAVEKNNYLEKYPESRKFIFKVLGSKEFIRGEDRFCLWIEDNQVSDALKIPWIEERISKIKKFRLSSKREDTRKFAEYPHRFVHISYRKTPSIIIPRVSSERRKYIPIGFLNSGTIITDLAFSIYDAEPYMFGLVSSKIHMVWVLSTAGRLKSDYRYSAGLTYNTFPVPTLSDKQKEIISAHVYNVLEEREKYPEKTMADLYDPEKMPNDLKEAHHNLDFAVERCYRSKPFETDEERLEYLFRLYEEMTEKEKVGELL